MNEIAKNTKNEIQTLHNEIEQSLQVALDKAIRIGELLTQVKTELKHGEFTPWINENLTFSQRTAQRYIKLFENRDKIIEAGGINEAYKAIGEPKSDTVSYLIVADLSDSIMKLGALLEQAEVGETITGVNIHGNTEKYNPPHLITTMKCENDKAKYEMAFLYGGESDPVNFIYSVEPVPIGSLLFFLNNHPKYSVEESRWLYPGISARTI